MTNEQYIEAIEKRRSRREYKNRPLDPEIMGILKEMVAAVNETAGLDLMFIEDATPVFKIFKGKFSMIAVCGPNTQKAREDCGFYGESIVLHCVYHGLGTCWVSGTYNENKTYQMINLPNDKRLYGVITIGYAKDSYGLIESTMYKATHKKNKPYQKMLSVCDQKLPEEYIYAMKLVEAAPSAVNRRPVNFKYENGKISASVDEPYSDKSIDFGIAKLHFMLGCRAKGINGHWTEDNFFEETEAQRIKFKPKETENEDE